MAYFVFGVTINGGHFWVDNICSETGLEEEHDKIASTVAYFGGGSVTIYEIDFYKEVSIKSFEKIDGNPEIFLDNEEIY